MKMQLPQRINEDIAKAGREAAIYDEFGNFYGIYKLALFNLSAKHVRVEIDKWNRKNAEKIKKRELKENDGLIKAFVDIAVLGWEQVALTEDGSEIPFSKENAYQLFTLEQADWLTTELIKFASDITNYGPIKEVAEDGTETVIPGDVEAEQEADAKK